MIFRIIALTLSLQANSQTTNPYSQYGYTTYPQYQQYKMDPAPSANENASCRDPNWDSDCVCDQQKQKIAWVKERGQALDSFNWSAVRSKQLVMIGDAHGISNPDSILDLINRSQANDTEKQCVLFEMSSDWTSDQFLKLLQEKTGNPEADRLRRYYGKIARGALDYGFSLHMIDDPRNWSGSRDATDYEREVHMAKTIKNLFQNQKCKHAILVVGKTHISGGNLPQSLTQLGISLTRLNPISAPNAGRSGPAEEWNGLCTSQTYSPSEATIFENSGIKNAWVIPGFTPPLSDMKFGNFDYSILFPDGQFEKRPPSQSNSSPTKRVEGIR